jgi:hypothetical protein
LKRLSVLGLLAAVFTAASCLGDHDPPEPGAAPPAAEPPEDTCDRTISGAAPVDTGSLAEDVLELSREIFECAAHVVVATDEDVDAVVAGAQLAAALNGPLLLPHPELASELERLDPTDVYLVGAVEAAAPDGSEVHRLTPADAAATTADTLQVTEQIQLPTGTTTETFTHTLTAIAEQDRVAVPAAATPGADSSPAPDGTPATEAAAGTEQTATTGEATTQVDLGEIIAGLPTTGDRTMIWLVESSDPTAMLAVTPAAAAADSTVVPVDGSNLFRYPQLAEPLAGRDEQSIRPIGAIPAETDWELRTLTNGYQLPGGGYELFPDDTMRRFVAFYGHPDTPAMGALGQQDGPESTYERMQPLLDDYAAGSDIVVPTFNVIATVAHNGGATGRPDEVIEFSQPYYVDYSTMHPPERFREWVDYAAEIDGYFMMDFQSGRNDFLFQVQHYEELLRLPHVSVALDPEWRLGPDQVHLQQIGSATAAEINTVIDWLAELVREEGLPPKPLVIQQFRLAMIQDRDELIDRDEVEVVIQMDGEGQGGLGVKDETWRVITAGTEDAHWHWGWKNFFVRDNPGPNSPEDTMSKEPSPVYVSYQ